MSRKLKGILTASALLVFSAVTVTGLASCQQEEVPNPTDEVEITKITISNKADLAKSHSLTEGRLLMEIAVETSEGAGNANDLIASGDLVVTSSDTKVATVSGRYVTLVAEGKTTITVKNASGSVSDSFEIEVTPRAELELTSIGDIMGGKAEVGTTVNVKGQIVQNSSSGYFLGDADGNYIYVYKVLAAQYKVGDTVIVTGDVDEYGGLYQISSDHYDIAKNYMGEDINILDTIKYTELTAEMANNFGAKESEQTEFTKNALKNPVPVKVTVTLTEIVEEDRKYLWRGIGFDDKTVVYTGYMLATDMAELDLSVNARYTMEGFINGKGSHNQYTNRINFYPCEFTKEESIAPTEVKISSELTSLMIGQKTNLSHVIGPDGSAGTVTYTSSDETIVSVNGNTLEGLKPGEVTITGTVDGHATVKAEIKITVVDQEYKPASLAETIANAKKDDSVFFYGIYSCDIPNYGIVVEDGDKALLVYGGKAPSGARIGDCVTVQGTYDVYYDVPQIARGTSTVLKVSASDLPATPKEPTLVDLTKKEETVIANANRGVEVKEAVISNYSWTPADDDKGDDIAAFKVTIGDNTFDVRIDARYTSKEDMAKVADKQLNGAKISFDARLGFFKNNPQLQYVSNITVTEGSETPEEPVDPEAPTAKTTYEYTFKDGDLKAEGGTVELANLSWTYDSAADTYFKFDSSDYEKGYQIGSSKKPQTTAWHFTATLPEGSVVKGYKINAATAKDGVSSMTINVGEYSKKHTLVMESTDYIDYAMNTTADKFDIVMQAESKAMYLKSFTIYVD